MVFKITKSDRVGPDAIGGQLIAMAGHSAGDIAGFADAEAWEGNLSTGLFRFGPIAREAFELSGDELGLLALIRSFDTGDHIRLLNIFERAAREPSRFCFSSSIARSRHLGLTVFCIGRSIPLAPQDPDGEPGQVDGRITSSHGRGGAISGLFIFPSL